MSYHFRFRFKMWRFKVGQYKRNVLGPKWDKLIHFRKCSCGHPLWMHVCYEHGTCIHGVCLSEHLGSGEDCCCDGFNSMWNKEYPPNRPELRK